MKFTQKSLEALTEQGKYSDPITSGLFLKIRTGGSKSWFYRRMVRGKDYETGLGSFRRVNLAQARSIASGLYALPPEEFIAYIEAKKNKKAIEEKDKNSSLTFRQAQQKFIDWNIEVGNWQELDKAHKVFEGRMRNHILPVIGDKPIQELTAEDIAEIAKPIWDKPATVERCLRFIRQVFDWSKAKRYCTQDNPADRNGVLKYLLPQQRHVTKNRGAISVAELPEFFASIKKDFEYMVSGKCFLFAVLTATRSETARYARWEQINLEEKEWIIPPEQLKMSGNGALIVPLADCVVDWIKTWKPENAEGYLFSNDKGKPLSDSIVSRLIAVSCRSGNKWIDTAQSAKLGKEVRPTLHGVARATFRTWSQDDSLGNDKRFDSRIAELCLHHKVKDIYNGAYERNEHFKRRREMMTAWAEYCFSRVSN